MNNNVDKNLFLDFEVAEDGRYARIKTNKKLLDKAIVRGYFSPFNSSIYNLLRKYNNMTAYGYFYFDSNSIALQSISHDTPNLEMCNDCNDKFQMVIPFESGKVTWLFPKIKNNEDDE